MKIWYALYVKSRAEKKVADRLKSNGFEVFCPIKTECRQWSDRKKLVEIPYFSSYVFVRFSMKFDRLLVLETPGVVKVLSWLGKPAMIRDEEMEEVMQFFATYHEREILQEHFVNGAAYRVKSGHLEGHSGVVVWQNSGRVVLDVPSLNIRFNVKKECLVPCEELI